MMYTYVYVVVVNKGTTCLWTTWFTRLFSIVCRTDKDLDTLFATGGRDGMIFCRQDDKQDLSPFGQHGVHMKSVCVSQACPQAPVDNLRVGQQAAFHGEMNRHGDDRGANLEVGELGAPGAMPMAVLV